MLVELNYNREKKKAVAKIVYSVMMFENGMTTHETSEKSYDNCRLTQTGDSIVLIKDDAPSEIEMNTQYVLAIYPKSISIITFE